MTTEKRDSDLGLFNNQLLSVVSLAIFLGFAKKVLFLKQIHNEILPKKGCRGFVHEVFGI